MKNINKENLIKLLNFSLITLSGTTLTLQAIKMCALTISRIKVQASKELFHEMTTSNKDKSVAGY